MSKVLVTPRSFGKTDPVAWQMLDQAGHELVEEKKEGSKIIFVIKKG